MYLYSVIVSIPIFFLIIMAIIIKTLIFNF